MKTRITRIVAKRLYNIGSYEHVSYELEEHIPEGESAAEAMIGLERILAAISPKTSTHEQAELIRARRYVEKMKEQLAKEGAESFRRHLEGTPEEYIARCEASCDQNEAARAAWEQQHAKARQMLDDLGGAAKWTDSKLYWED